MLSDKVYELKWFYYKKENVDDGSLEKCQNKCSTLDKK